MANLNGSYDGGSGNVFRLNIEENSEAKGTFSGKFHDTRTNQWQNVSGSFSFYGDGRDETVLWFSINGHSWRWEADYKNGKRNFDEWSASRTSKTDPNDVETTTFHKEV